MAESVTNPAGVGGGSSFNLSIKLEELQALINEVRALREENVRMFNELAKHHTILKKVLDEIDGNVSYNDFGKLVKRQVALNSAKFVIENMHSAKFKFYRMDLLKDALKLAEIDGLYLEFGVFKGTSLNVIAESKPDKIVYGFDSFEGLPEDWEGVTSKGTFNVNGALPEVKENVKLVKGWFNETLPDFVKEHPEPCAFIHIDCDLYSSTKTVFNELKNKIVKGTVIVFDEYLNYLGWENGEHKAFTELLEESNLTCDYFFYSAMQVAVKIK